MSHGQLLHDMDHALRQLLPQFSRPLQKSLAAALTGTVLAESAVLSQAASAMPGRATNRSHERRLQRLVANPHLASPSAQAALIRSVLGARRGRLNLLLDATTTGASARDAGTHTLVLSLGLHGRAQPLAWQSWTADQPGQKWVRATDRLLAAVAAQQPPATDPVVMADRGLSGRSLAEAVRSHAWHFLLRVIRTTRIQMADGTVQTLATLAPEPGTSCLLEGVRIWAPRRKRGRVWHTDWEQGVVVNVVAVWRHGDPEPWFLVTDLPAQRRRGTEYRERTWEEEGFRDTKSLGLRWEHSRVRDPQRVERLLLLIAFALLWLMGLGQRVVRCGWRRQLDDRRRRTLSYFQLGRRWLRRQRVNDQRLPCCLSYWAESAAPVRRG